MTADEASRDSTQPWSSDDFQTRLKKLSHDGAGLQSEYLRAAAVLTSFDPWDLRPTSGQGTAGQAYEELADHALAIGPTSGGHLWTLLPSVRKQVLGSMRGRSDLALALAANADRPQTIEQEVFEAYVRGSPKPLERQNREELQASLDAVTWLYTVLPDIPHPNDVEMRVERLRLRDTFERLVGSNFAGRERDLQALGQYVGFLEDPSLRHRLRRDRTTPFLIYGPGGVGKSTLVAKFILMHGYGKQANSIPFSYLDFDDASLATDTPSTLLWAMARQLRVQYLSSAQSWVEFADWLRSEIRTDRIRSSELEVDEFSSRPIRDQIREFQSEQAAKERDRVARFSALLRESVEGEDMPFLLVLDTFEEVQYRRRDELDDLWAWLSLLRSEVPAIRVVISGRAELGDEALNLQGIRHPLHEFDERAAVGFLLSRGVQSEEDAYSIARQLGGNPLTLLLAAQVYQLEGSSSSAQTHGIEGLPGRRWLLFRASESKIQGVLYQRVIGHLHEHDYPGLRLLAQRALVLRRITSELIYAVLARPDGFDVSSLEESKTLFVGLSRELSLIARNPDGSLSHRRDVRALVLPDLESDQPALVDALHHAAIEFYSASESPSNDSELLYHHLKLGHSGPEIDALWDPSIADSLRLSLHEFGAPEQAFLAKHMGLSDLAAEVQEAANLETWERQARHRALAQMRRRDFVAVDRLLSEREDRSENSPLHLVKLLADVARGDYEAVVALLPHARAEAEKARDRRNTMLYSVVEAHLLERSEQTELAADRLADSSALAHKLGDWDVALAVDLHRLHLVSTIDELEGVELTAVEAFDRLPEERFHQTGRTAGIPSLPQAAVGIIGALNPAFLSMTILLPALGPFSPEGLRRTSERLEELQGDSLEGLSEFLAHESGPADDAREAGWQPLLELHAGSGRFGAFLNRLLTMTECDVRVAQAIAQLLEGDNRWSCYLPVYRLEIERSYQKLRQHGAK